jgi:hypothetical protein
MGRVSPGGPPRNSAGRKICWLIIWREYEADAKMSGNALPQASFTCMFAASSAYSASASTRLLASPTRTA